MKAIDDETISWAKSFAHSSISPLAPARRRVAANPLDRMINYSDRTSAKRNFKTAVFAIAVFAKAWEPVLVDWSQTKPGSTEGAGYEYSLSAAIACAEAVKGAVCDRS